jgi:hypothetical protein
MTIYYVAGHILLASLEAMRPTMMSESKVDIDVLNVNIKNPQPDRCFSPKMWRKLWGQT